MPSCRKGVKARRLYKQSGHYWLRTCLCGKKQKGKFVCDLFHGINLNAGKDENVKAA